MPYGLRGLAEYPGYYCYDASRPSWLPYWLDDITESTCKYSPKTIAGNIVACATGDPSCNPPTPAQANPALPGPGTAAPGEQTNVPVCSGLYSLDIESNTCTLQLTSTPVLLAGGVFILLLAFVTGGRH